MDHADPSSPDFGGDDADAGNDGASADDQGLNDNLTSAGVLEKTEERGRKNQGRKSQRFAQNLQTENEKKSVLRNQVDALMKDPIAALGCHAACAKENALPGILSGIAIISGQNIVQTEAKFKGATPNTSIASKVARSIFGKAQSPIALPAPTLNAMTAKSRNIGAIVGRATPIGGYIGAVITGRAIDQCSGACSEAILSE